MMKTLFYLSLCYSLYLSIVDQSMNTNPFNYTIVIGLLALLNERKKN